MTTNFHLLQNNEIGISFPYDTALIQRVKSLSKRRWDSATKQWICPLEIAPEIQILLNQKLPEHILSQYNLLYIPQPISFNPTLLKVQPYPFQIEGIQFASQIKNVLIADDVGLGKTLQAIATALHLDCKKVLVICPASVKRQWQKEIERFTSHTSQIIEGTQKQRQNQYSQSIPTFFITNYELILKDISIINLRQWDMVIADEITRVKNYRAKTTFTLKKINTNFKLGLSATPIENSLQELHSIISWIAPKIFGKWWDFMNQYCYYHKTSCGSNEVTGVRNKELLYAQLRKVMIRRKKSDVFQQLPPIIRQEYYVPLSLQQQQLYDNIKNQILTLISKDNFNHNDQLNTLTQLLYLREVCNSPRLLNPDLKENGKVSEIIEILKQTNPTEKVVIFSQWTKFLDLLKNEMHNISINEKCLCSKENPMTEAYTFEEKCPKHRKIYTEITGDLSQEQRDKNIQEFNTNPDVRFLLSSEAGGVGLNLQFASVVIHCDLLWNPQKMHQREGRVHRIGQDKTVTVITVLTENTIEEKVYNLLKEKQILFDEIIEGQKIDRETIKELMR